MDCSVFTATYEGEVRESEEMMPKRFTPKDIPFDKMWADGKIRLPALLAGAEHFVYEFRFTSAEDTLPKRKKLQ
ncbi:MAG: hypothetical protein LBG59_05550 [Candidatus Peribacteria bacterium]|jgi:hypothetical protein|nr:hypothetical protein [Candidatus Peribacteria bacterium]